MKPRKKGVERMCGVDCDDGRVEVGMSPEELRRVAEVSHCYEPSAEECSADNELRAAFFKELATFHIDDQIILFSWFFGLSEIDLARRYDILPDRLRLIRSVVAVRVCMALQFAGYPVCLEFDS